MIEGGRGEELPAAAAEHAASCARCAAFLGDIQAIEAALGAARRAPVPARVRRSLMSAFDEEYGAPRSPAWSFWPVMPRLLLAGAAAGALALAVWMGRPPGTAGPEMEIVKLSVTMIPD
ncbi:MAG TPA: hypothetical protein DD417_01640 [Elusimicrobia bacterium]|nr:hypothetical protein [Elusimicrobiota bacterium]